MFIIDPPATAGGTDLLQVQLLTFEAKPSVAKTCIFRVGGVGYGGQKSKEELALYDLLEDAHTLDALHSLVKTGSYEGGLYGLTAIQSGRYDRMLNAKYRPRNN